MSGIDRRQFLARALTAGGAFLLGGCDRLSQSVWFPKVLDSAEFLNRTVQRALTPRDALATEFPESYISPVFRPNGSTDPQNPAYRALAAGGFRDYRLEVRGLVEHPMSLSLDELRALPSRTQITRHDCVEGWSVIGKWKGARLSALLDRVQPLPAARYVMFHCADTLGSSDARYYESIDMLDAYHPQTILAYELNDRTVPIENGAPLRVRIERQLGYKMAKYIMAIELVESFVDIKGGKGGYWEDRGYEWYAGI
ncbi:MAG: molybdopterin-dependent oxidoreductase [Gammaproteobacteria bacterium]|nr:molybdopterin-dependent oxidoreductase [Gammaproteobacteria bacterium]